MFKKMLKLVTFLSTLIVTGLIYSSVETQKLEAYQFTGISSNTDGNRHRQLLWVRNQDNAAHESGDVLQWIDGGTADGLEVSTSATDNDGLVAGVVSAEGTIAAESWGFLQTQGYHAAITVQKGVAAGVNLMCSTTTEAGTPYLVKYATGTTAGEADTFGVYAVTLEASETGTVKGFILR